MSNINDLYEKGVKGDMLILATTLYHHDSEGYETTDEVTFEITAEDLDRWQRVLAAGEAKEQEILTSEGVPEEIGAQLELPRGFLASKKAPRVYIPERGWGTVSRHAPKNLAHDDLLFVRWDDPSLCSGWYSAETLYLGQWEPSSP